MSSASSEISKQLISPLKTALLGVFVGISPTILEQAAQNGIQKASLEMGKSIEEAGKTVGEHIIEQLGPLPMATDSNQGQTHLTQPAPNVLEQNTQTEESEPVQNPNFPNANQNDIINQDLLQKNRPSQETRQDTSPEQPPTEIPLEESDKKYQQFEENSEDTENPDTLQVDQPTPKKADRTSTDEDDTTSQTAAHKNTSTSPTPGRSANTADPTNADIQKLSKKEKNETAPYEKELKKIEKEKKQKENEIKMIFTKMTMQLGILFGKILFGTIVLIIGIVLLIFGVGAAIAPFGAKSIVGGIFTFLKRIRAYIAKIAQLEREVKFLDQKTKPIHQAIRKIKSKIRTAMMALRKKSSNEINNSPQK